ncbi:D-glycero-alpha-D-manno-heptose-1,7-bisphosphate 7-phosphatase [Clostridium tepidiprofundi DSM 19306]|uniref:D,D-heptose 1,7-bisphosphate phosphatase n=1 Tax=Clostridium tepidiprofundi DSM 19306 TaxID=1121338 RepID=A0A151B3I5_9CLOT|nr:HAD family hydrolase [Clostridium tepidiprofundi]KYH34471.1 D-glycero-alpha-D-manno-heptose-1,7-bisphosphate 7-phosphatase [Clostridium tepidiprofundi DSM 19306]
MNKALFLDRDGVINKEKNYLYKIEDFEFIEGVFETLKYFQDKGYLLIIITNQAGIGRGYYTEVDFQKLNNWMIKQFRLRDIVINKVYYCPYHPVYGIGKYKRQSYDRKPNPGMILRAQKDFEIDLSKSILIGDKESDIQAGIVAGVGINVIVKTGYKIDEANTNADYVVENLSNIKRQMLF